MGTEAKGPGESVQRERSQERSNVTQQSQEWHRQARGPSSSNGGLAREVERKSEECVPAVKGRGHFRTGKWSAVPPEAQRPRKERHGGRIRSRGGAGSPGGLWAEK